MTTRGSRSDPPQTPDGRYIIVRGVLWRRSDPSLPEAQRKRLLSELGKARNAVKQAKAQEDADALRRARQRVHQAKVGLGERGPTWWADDAPDCTGQRIENTPYG